MADCIVFTFETERMKKIRKMQCDIKKKIDVNDGILKVNQKKICIKIVSLTTCFQIFLHDFCNDVGLFVSWKNGNV